MKETPFLINHGIDSNLNQVLDKALKEIKQFNEI